MKTIILYIIFILTCSCDIIPDAERSFNDSVTPPSFQTTQLTDIENGQHFAGIFKFTVDLSDIGYVTTIVLYLDGKIIQSNSAYPYQFEINTEYYSEGEHKLSLGIYSNNIDLGLLELIKVPDLIHEVSVVFDWSRPNSVELTSVEWYENNPKLTWTENTDPNFYAYVIRRGDFIIHTIYDQKILSYVDTGIRKMVGVGESYSIEVSNRVVIARSNYFHIQYGFYILHTVLNYDMPEIPEQDIFCFISKGSVNREVEVNKDTREFNEYFSDPNKIIVSPDGVHNCIIRETDLIFKKRHPYEIISEYKFNYMYNKKTNFVLNKDNILYFLTLNRQLRSFNLVTGEEKDLLWLNIEDGQADLLMDNEKNILYIVELLPSEYNKSHLYKFDLNIGNERGLQEITLPKKARSMKANFKENKLALLVGSSPLTVEFWNSTDLTFISEIAAPNNEDIYGFYMSEDVIYLSYKFPDRNKNCTKISSINMNSKQILNTIEFESLIQVFQVSNNNRTVYGFDGMKLWIEDFTN